MSTFFHVRMNPNNNPLNTSSLPGQIINQTSCSTSSSASSSSTVPIPLSLPISIPVTSPSHQIQFVQRQHSPHYLTNSNLYQQHSPNLNCPDICINNNTIPITDIKYINNKMNPNLNSTSNSNSNLNLNRNPNMNINNISGFSSNPLKMGQQMNIQDYNTENLNVTSTSSYSPPIFTSNANQSSVQYQIRQSQHDFTPPPSATQEYSTSNPIHPPSHYSFSSQSQDGSIVSSNSQPVLLVQNQSQSFPAQSYTNSKSFNFDSYNSNNYENNANRINKLSSYSRNSTNTRTPLLSQYAKSNLMENLNNQYHFQQQHQQQHQQHQPQPQQQAYYYNYNMPLQNNFSNSYDKISMQSSPSDSQQQYQQFQQFQQPQQPQQFQQNDYNISNTVYTRMNFVDNINMGNENVSKSVNSINDNRNFHHLPVIQANVNMINNPVSNIDNIHLPPNSSNRVTPTSEIYRKKSFISRSRTIESTLDSSKFPEITATINSIDKNDLIATTQIQPYKEIMFDPDFFIDRNYDFKISNNLDKDCNISLNNNSNKNLKSKFDSTIVDNEIKTIISKLNSTQLQKFAETKYFAVSGSTILPKIALNKFIFGGANNAEILLKDNIINSWKLTRSSINLYSCSCENFICMGSNKINCPHDNIIDNESNDEQTVLHKKELFTIELFNNYILSILLNKKLRIFLKKTLRPSKLKKENKNFLNLIQDGTIYKESIANDIDKIDFAFTFSLLTPNILTSGIKGKNLTCVYLVLNELPAYLRYKPEFMFLACAVDSDQNLEFNKTILFPLFEYFNHLQNKILRISLNRHEYHVKISMIMALSNDQYGKGGLLNTNSLNSINQCIFCNVPRCTIKDSLGHEFKPIYNCEKFQNELIEKGLYDDNNQKDDKCLNPLMVEAASLLEPLKSFDCNKGLLIDSKKWILEKLFKNTISWIIKNYFKSNPTDSVHISFKIFVSNIQTNIINHEIFEDSNVLLKFTDPSVTEVYFNSSISDLKIVQNIFHFLFNIYFHEIYETSNNMFKILPEKFKVLSWLIELNSYITALFCTEVDKNKVPILRNALKDLIAEMEQLSRYDMFKNINHMLGLPLHYLCHLYEKWEQIGDFSAISMSYMNESIDVFKKLSENNSIDKNVLQEKIKCLNIVNSMKIYKFQKPDYPDFEFLNSEFTDINRISNKSKIKFDEFLKKFLFDAIELSRFNQCTQIEEITSFKLNNIIIKPEDKPSPLNLVRIKGLKKGSNWRYVHVYGMKRATYIDLFTKEKITGVFIEYKETRTKKRFQKTSPNRPAFSLGEYLTSKSCGKELRCVWLDDISMVALRVLTESNWIYDPNILLERAFEV
ncbi:hypothetical protein C6P40_003515 [Pichia californica]|uniref:Uncharacterized protein n=1 Tax=Pichia californica TaxID=460514 RepID=A0A9P7BI99_9ASCO|nr:hypothetical protein C6P42_004746 [[Candida] californica]KAG0691264.1 hypothetical protein C6P40_003515 [[Candida] californica]